jgi:hypothetical protein
VGILFFLLSSPANEAGGFEIVPLFAVLFGGRQDGVNNGN